MLKSALTLAMMLAAGSAGATPARTAPPGNTAPPPPDPEVAALGERLFFDTALSANQTLSCATCHDPEHAFADPRPGRAGLAVSVGADGESHGDRNTPTISYAAFAPGFHEFAPGAFKGGQFWDGRAADLREQAGLPMLNPVEMGMPDKETIAARLAPEYTVDFEAIWGKDVLDDPEASFDALTEALAAYEQTEAFAPFDSRYDRWLRGEEKFTAEEEFGHTVFITWNCRLCHMSRKQGVSEFETFTNFEYHNIGVPVNHAARDASGLGDAHVDRGLSEHPGIDDAGQDGRFKVPTLRNVAVTGPYMHNGVFEDLRSVVLFYNIYTSRRASARINPETGEDWGPPEVAANLSLTELQSGLMLDDRRVDALVAFLETLTDRRYEPLLAEQKAQRAAAKAKKLAATGD